MPKIPFTCLVEQQAHYRRLNRFVAQTLGSGDHILPLWEPTLVRVIYDDDDDDDIYFDVEIVDPIAPDISVTLKDVVEWVERTHGVIPNYDLPDATPSEDQALRASIAKHGVKYPIILDENSQIIDGRRRKRIADDLRVHCPSISIDGLTRDQKRGLALELDLCRKDYSRTQKAVLIKNLLRWGSSESSRRIAALVGCDHKTVEKYRKELLGRGEIPQLNARIGKDGKRYPTRSVLANTENERIRAAKALQQLPPSCDNKIVDVTTAKRRARRQARKEARESRIIKPLEHSDIQIHHCGFQGLEEVAGITPGSVKLVLADVPYTGDFLPELPALVEMSARILVEGGLLVMHTGIQNLNRILPIVDQSLTFRWMMSAAWDEQDAPVFRPLNVINRWTPILVYSKGDWSLEGGWCDLFILHGKEKQWHEWQKPISHIEDLVEYFSDPNDLVVDPVGGGFTSAVACLKLNRRCISCDCDENAVATGHRRLKEEWERIVIERAAD
jgi:hypothetical protein